MNILKEELRKSENQHVSAMAHEKVAMKTIFIKFLESSIDK